MAVLTVLTSFFDCVLSRCMVANAKTELWLWSKTFAEGSSASVLISTTTVLWNMNLLPLCIITRERHPPLFWPLWDNFAHTIIMDLHAHRYTPHTLRQFVIHKKLSLSFTVLFFQANSRLYLIFFVFSFCYWFVHVVSMSVRDFSWDLASLQKSSPRLTHIHDRKGRHASKTKVYTSLHKNRVSRGVF